MGRHVGSNDSEVREAVRGLRVGDFVNLTLLTSTNPAARQPRLARLTRIGGPHSRGRLVDRRGPPGPPGPLTELRLAFTAVPTHPLPKGQVRHAP
jgi:hypothetical protein